MGPHPETPPLDVQHYVGSCLIRRPQQPGRPKRRPPAGCAWTGAPLIRRDHAADREYGEPHLLDEIARLALHAQGAPLIRGAAPPSDCALSTTSEDSGGAPEPGLPRILKPRKRRKKEQRRPAHPVVTLKPYQPLCYGQRHFEPEPRQGYPHAPSARCRCHHCVPPPSALLTPPDSPVGEGAPTPHDNDGTSRPAPLLLTSSHPPTRPWIQVSNPNPQSSCTFTVMCYNILCDKYATRQMYGYCPNWALEWSYRKRNILNEILHYKADIISLQEVETEQFYKFFLPELQKEGYDGIFSPKSRAKTMSESERKHVDGCAIFYKNDKFFLLKEHLVEFNQLAMANAEGSDDMLNRVMTKDNIGLAALLQTRMGAYDGRAKLNYSTQTLLVCTAHIHWDPEYSDVKLIQTMMLMHELKAFVDDILDKCNLPSAEKADPNIIPLLLCGDFNSLPDSGVIEYLSSGRVSTCHIDFKEIAYKDCLSKLGSTTNSNEFTHPFQITRAYNDGIMPFTNYSYDFKGVIDYVFYSKQHMNVLGVLGPIDAAWLEENHIHGCPHPHIPSDHFPIVVELQLYPTPSLHPPPPNGLSLHRGAPFGACALSGIVWQGKQSIVASRACGDSVAGVDWINTHSLFCFFSVLFLQPWNSNEERTTLLREVEDGPAVLLRVPGPVVPEGPEARGVSEQDPSVCRRGLGPHRPQRPLDPEAALVEPQPLQGHRSHGDQESHGARQDRRRRQGTRLHQGKVQGRGGTRLQDVPDHPRDLVRFQAGVQHDGHPRKGEQEERGRSASHPLRDAQEERLHEGRQQQQVALALYSNPSLHKRKLDAPFPFHSTCPLPNCISKQWSKVAGENLLSCFQ